MRRLLRHSATCLRSLISDQEGQSMVFGAITMFVLVLFTAFVINMGQVSNARMGMQNAADAAAYSGALVEANSLSAIAFVNDGMSYVYYNMMRYAVDREIYRLLKRFKTEHIGASERPAPDEVVWGKKASFDQKATEVLRRSEEMLLTGERWLGDLHEIQVGIAKATPELMLRAIFEVARADGAEKVAVHPNLETLRARWNPENSVYFRSEREAERNEVSTRFYQRYEQRRLGVDPNAVALPNWYDQAKGEAVQGQYNQIRTCWNPNDLGHSDMWGPHLGGQYAKHTRSPNGHWHMQHTHVTATTPPTTTPPHIHGHGSHPEHAETADGQTPPHHYALTCPTCKTQNNDMNDPQNHEPDMLTDVKKSLGEKSAPRRIDWANAPGPLVLTEDLLTQPVHVAVWRGEEAASPWIGQVFDVPDWGFVAVASAQVGRLESDDRVTTFTHPQARKQFVKSDDNLYGVEWAARLVPSNHLERRNARGGGLTSGSGGAGGTHWWAELLTGRQSWKTRFSDASYDQTLPAALERMSPTPGGRPAMSFRPGQMEKNIVH